MFEIYAMWYADNYWASDHVAQVARAFLHAIYLRMDFRSKIYDTGLFCLV